MQLVTRLAVAYTGYRVTEKQWYAVTVGQLFSIASILNRMALQLLLFDRQ